MKKLLILGMVAAGVVLVWTSQHGARGPLDDLQQRLDAAEQSYQQAGRAAGMSGVDTSAGAGSALAEVEQVERELHDLSQAPSSPEEKKQIDQLLTRAKDLKRKMG